MRKILLISFVVCSFFVSGGFVHAETTLTPAQIADGQAQADRIRNLQSQIGDQQATVAQLQSQAQSSPGGGNQAALQQAQQVLQGLMNQLTQATAGLTNSDKMCNPVMMDQCGCHKELKCDSFGGCKCVASANMHTCACWEIPQTGQRVDGICIGPVNCLGQTFTGLNGQTTGVGDIGNIVGQIFKGILDKVMGGAGAGGGGSSSSGGSTGQGCTQYYQVTVPSADPCAQYVPPSSSSLIDTGTGQSSVADQLLNALQGGTALDLNSGSTRSGQGNTPVSVSDTLLNLIQGTTNATTSGPFSNLSGSQVVNLQSGTRGNIVMTDTGATVIANARDTQTNSEVAGFYGSDTFGNSQPQGLVAQMCRSRPWASSVISFVIPPSFFDSLCAWRGYQVGQPVTPAPQLQVRTHQTAPQNTTPTSTPVVTVPPSAYIWATPATVALGTRTSVFWSAKGVASCTETSPSGSFFQSTFSGGASTVPITSPTTFIISCLTTDGTSVSDSVTVNLAI